MFLLCQIDKIKAYVNLHCILDIRRLIAEVILNTIISQINTSFIQFIARKKIKYYKHQFESIEILVKQWKLISIHSKPPFSLKWNGFHFERIQTQKITLYLRVTNKLFIFISHQTSSRLRKLVRHLRRNPSELTSILHSYEVNQRRKLVCRAENKSEIPGSWNQKIEQNNCLNAVVTKAL